MYKDISLGSYCEKKSFIHSLNPLTKLFTLVLCICTLFLSRSFAETGFCLVFLFLVAAFAGVRIRLPLSFSLAIVIFTVIRMALYGFSLHGVTDALLIALRLLGIVLFSSLYSAVTRPDDSARAVEKILSPFPFARRAGLVFSIALRFIPVLSDQAKKLILAQKSRCGLEYSRKKNRIKSILSLLVPLFVCAYRKSAELAMAMTSRCYRPDGKSTHLYEMKLEEKDVMAFLDVMIFFFLFLYIHVRF
ncbi:MAG: energy-coupling factor transporter transmembrane protein EcfT [Sphaerochaetaceae bacterium]|nr:energy-coupling factor transporter transmembrane protein EcfT [Sphaerochaetaceae bacterium]